MLRLKINKNDNIQNQIVKGIIELTNKGDLKFGDHLPSITAMSDSLLISRTSVIGAYEKLVKLGIIQSKERSGYFISTIIDDNQGTRSTTKVMFKEKAGNKPQQDRIYHARDVRIPDVFVRNFFTEIRLRKNSTAEPLDIRQLMSDMLLSMRRIKANYSTSIITKNVISFLLTVAVAIKKRTPSPTIILEYPCYNKVHDIFSSLGFKIILVPVDQHGLQVENLESLSADCIYLTPAHQFPTGALLSQERRDYLAAWCQKNHVWLIEDDSLSLMNLSEKTSSPIYVSHPSEKNIYVSSMALILGSENGASIGLLPADLYPEISQLENILYSEDSVLSYRLVSNYLHSNRVIRDIANLAHKRRKKYQLATEGLRRAFGHPQIWGIPRSIYFSFLIPPGITVDHDKFPSHLIPMSTIFDTFGFSWLGKRIIYPFAALEMDQIKLINDYFLKIAQEQ
ncbi:aminotransferase class I/II-fold pyridoxal phosphate-dependent enzyme [Yersinia massiliensis]|uniref:aminotransferase class I/II-fold pyridoxal phosphate-dependent enzyme n=1 Tax=Yersinia massiliensis TaxID=419257 RepID=UPI0011A0DCBB|nr:aminotransferase class I/II-fold pyridoxal phosphate-dependent enzyme [Yersinia massiliensis]